MPGVHDTQCRQCGETQPDRFYRSRWYQCKDCHKQQLGLTVVETTRPELGPVATMSHDEFWDQVAATFTEMQHSETRFNR